MKNGRRFERGRHEKLWRVSTHQFARHYWHATYEVNPNHFVVGTGKTERDALRQLVIMMAERGA